MTELRGFGSDRLQQNFDNLLPKHSYNKQNTNINHKFLIMIIKYTLNITLSVLLIIFLDKRFYLN